MHFHTRQQTLLKTILDMTASIAFSAIKEVITDVCCHARIFPGTQYPAMPTIDACFLWDQPPLSCIFPERERALLKIAGSVRCLSNCINQPKRMTVTKR